MLFSYGHHHHNAHRIKVILHGPGIPGPAVDRRAISSSLHDASDTTKLKTAEIAKNFPLRNTGYKVASAKQLEVKSRIQKANGRLTGKHIVEAKKKEFSIIKRGHRILSKVKKGSKLGGKRILSELIREKASKNSAKKKKKVQNLNEIGKKKFSSTNVVCNFYGSCNGDPYPFGSLHVFEGRQGEHSGHADYGHHDYGAVRIDHQGTSYGHNGGYLMGSGHYGIGSGHYGEGYGHHDLDNECHGLDHGHHNLDYGHLVGDHHVHIEPIHIAEEHHNHVVHHAEAVPVPVPVPVAVPAPAQSNPASSNPAPAVANKAASDAVVNTAPASIAVSAVNMNGGQATGTQNNAAQTINTGYPVYYLPPAAPVIGKPAPDLVKPVPPANGPNPYEILTSDTLKAAAGQQKNEADGSSSGGNPSNSISDNSGDKNSGDKDAKESQKDEKKEDKKPAGVTESGGSKHKPVNTEVDHSSHFSKKYGIFRKKAQFRQTLSRNSNSLASRVEAHSLQSRKKS